MCCATMRKQLSPLLPPAAPQFIRVNVLSGSMYTDQGLIEGKAADVARLRMALDPTSRCWQTFS